MYTTTVASGQGGGLGWRHPILFTLLALDLGLVVLQYALGMYVNLYVQIPFGTAGGGWMGMMGSGGMFALMTQPAAIWHMMNGMLLFFFLLVTAIASLFTGNVRLVLASWVGLVFVIVAAAGGMAFLASGGVNAFSLLMALGALGVLFSLSVALILAWIGGAARNPQSLSSTGNALELLDARYARGEIGREEYLRAKHDITET